MVTPVETAGLVLATLQFAITLLGVFRKGRDFFKSSRGYRSALIEIQAWFGVEKDYFQNTLERLLVDQLSQSQLKALFSDSRGPTESTLWVTMKIEKKLRFKLGDKFHLFKVVIDDMAVTLKKITKILEIGVDEKGAAASQFAGWLSSQRRKVRWGFRRREREELMKKFMRCNTRIADWVKGFEISQGNSKRRVEERTPYLALVRDHACRLHSILGHGLSSSCSNPHEANLRLDQRTEIEQSPSFHVYFSLQQNTTTQQCQVMRNWSGAQIQLKIEPHNAPGGVLRAPVAPAMWREATTSTTSDVDSRQTRSIPLVHLTSRPEPGRAVFSSFQPGPSPLAATPGRATQRMACLCQRIHDVQGSPNLSPPVFLEVPSQRHRVSIVAGDTPAASSTQLHLGMLLQSKHNSSSDSRYGELSRQQRLGLAITLASTVLQLYKSPWLDSAWGKRNILFFVDGFDEDNCPVIGDPYVLCPFGLPPHRSPPLPPSGNTTKETLLALGIMLIELCSNQPLEDLCPTGANDIRNLPTADRYEAADHMIDDVYREEGNRYGYAVQRCVRFEFGVRGNEKRLDSDRFRRLFYEDVILPLEEEYRWRSMV